jgi:hypothetical protein
VNQQDEQQQEPAPIEPGHVMTHKKYREFLKQQKQK